MTQQVFQPVLAGVSPIMQAMLIVAGLVPAAGAAAVDARSHRLPDRLVACAVLPVLAGVLLSDDHRRLVASIVLGSIAMAAPLLLVHLAVPAAMGFGDVKLAGALGAVLGLLAPALAMPALAAATGITLLVALCTRRAAMPFGPGLVVGVCGALVFGVLEGWRVAG